jgi:hypothetical protein
MTKSTFITESDPVIAHDYKPGHTQALTAYYSEKAGRLITLLCDMQEEDAQANGCVGSEAWMVLQEIINDLQAGRISDANNLAVENGLTIPGLKELAAEIDGDDTEIQSPYPHLN